MSGPAIKKLALSALKVAVLLALVAAAALGSSIWYVTKHPEVVKRLTPYVEDALSSEDGRLVAKIPNVSLVWNKEQRDFRFQSNDATLLFDGREVVSLPGLSFHVKLLPLLIGKIGLSHVMVENFHMTLQRRADGSMTLEDMSQESTGAPSEAPEWEEIVHQLLGIERGVLSSFGMLSDIELKQTKFTIHDEVTLLDTDFVFPAISFGRDWTGMSGLARLDVLEDGKPASFTLEFSYSKLNKTITINPSMVNFNVALIGKQHTLLDPLADIDFPVDGEVTATFAAADFSPLDIVWDLKGGEGALTLPTVWESTRPIKSIKTAGTLDGPNKSIKLTSLNVDFGGPTLVAFGEAHPEKSVAGDFAYTAQVQLNNVKIDAFRDYWPHTAAKNPRAWLVGHTSDGILKYATADVDGYGFWDDPDSIGLKDAVGKMAVSNATVVYFEGLPPVKGINLTADFDQNDMNIHVTSGSLENIKITPSEIKITGLSDKMQYIDIQPIFEGPFSTLLAVLDREPLGYAREIGLDPAKIQGIVSGKAQFVFPLLKNLPYADVKIAASSKIKNFASRDLLKGYPITEGMLDLELDGEGFNLSGTGNFDEVPLAIKWHEGFERADPEAVRRTIEATGKLEARHWDKIGLSIGTTSKGVSQAVIAMEQKNSSARSYKLDIDATQSELRLDDINYEKTIGQAFTLSAVGTSPDGTILNLTDITAKGLEVNTKGTAVIDLISGDLKNLQLDPFIIGLTNAKLSYEVDEKGGEKAVIEGQSLGTPKHDDRPSDYKTSAKTLDLKVNVKKLRATRERALTDVKITAHKDGMGWRDADIEIHGEGDVPLRGWLRTEGQMQHLDVICDDIGAILRAWNLTDDISGGRFSINGKGTDEHPRRIEAKIEIKDYKVKNMPAMAVLLNALSIVGIADMQKEGLAFERLAGKVTWEKDDLYIEDIHTSGGTLGLNLQGRVNLASYTADMRGTVVPFNFFSRVIGSIPLIGDILAGTDDGGIFAVAFSAKGPLKKLDVSVNPASMLTPGIFRQMFFSGDDNSSPDKPAPAPVMKSAPGPITRP